MAKKIVTNSSEKSTFELENVKVKRVSKMFICAHYYYELGLSMDNIGKELNINKSTVSRYIDEARDEMLIKVIPPQEIVIAKAIKNWFTNLKEVLIPDIDSTDIETGKIAVAKLAAEYLLDCFNKYNMKNIGISGGSTNGKIAEYINPSSILIERLHDIEVYALSAGGYAGGTQYTSSVLAVNLAQKLKTQRVHALESTVYFDKFNEFEEYMKKEEVQEFIKNLLKLDIMVLGIGDFDNNESTIFKVLAKSGIMETLKLLNESEEDENKKIAGDILFQLIDARGEKIRPRPEDENTERDFTKHILTLIDLEDLKERSKHTTKRTVAIVAGAKKGEKLLQGVLKQGYIDVLICDLSAARALLRKVRTMHNLV